MAPSSCEESNFVEIIKFLLCLIIWLNVYVRNFFNLFVHRALYFMFLSQSHAKTLIHFVRLLIIFICQVSFVFTLISSPPNKYHFLNTRQIFKFDLLKDGILYGNFERKSFFLTYFFTRNHSLQNMLEHFVYHIFLSI